MVKAKARVIITRSAAEAQAREEADRLVARLGPGWVARVWENLGWYYQARLTSGDHTIHVYPSTTGSHLRGGWLVRAYSASFDYKSWSDAKTPEGAVIEMIKEVRAEYEALGAVLAKAQRVAELPEGHESR